jgi:hypothetical protein
MKRLGAAVALAATCLLGCSSESLTAGLSEPIRVSYGNARNGQFLSGALPGTPSLSDQDILNGVAPQVPTASLNVSLGTVRQAETGFVASGSTSSEAVAIGIRLLDLGTGYWVVPVTGLDPTKPGTYNWNATLDFGGSIEPGKHPLAVVAIDAAGHAGSQFETPLCVLSDVPDNSSACSATAKPPFSVLSLNWDTPVDLDLRVVTPQGKVVDPKHPSTALAVDGKYDPTAPHTGVFDTDAERNCVHTGYTRENLVWQDAPVPGTYLVYVSLFDACGQAAVRFNLSLNRPGPAGDGGIQQLESTYAQAGELLSVDADAGAKLGLFVTEFVVE